MLTRRQRLILFLVVWAGFGLLLLIGGRTKADVMTQQTKQGFRVNVTTCADVRAVVAIVGEVEAERAARAAGASQAQIEAAKRCLPR